MRARIFAAKGEAFINMRSLLQVLTALLLLVATLVRAKSTSFRVVKNIPGRMPSNSYSAEVRDSASGAWMPGFVLQTIARNASHGGDMSGGPGGCGYFKHLNGWSASWLNVEIDAGTSVQIRVKRINGEPITTARPHPASAGNFSTVLISTFTPKCNRNPDA